MHHSLIKIIASLTLATASAAALSASVFDSDIVPPATQPVTPKMSFDQFREFVPKIHLLQKDEIAALPYIVGIEDGYLMASEGKLIYARGLTASRGAKFDIIRPAERYEDFDTGKLLGIAGKQVGTAINAGGGDPKTLRVLTNEKEILRGDLLVPATGPTISKLPGKPRAATVPVAGHIIDIIDGFYEAAHYQVVVIDRGTTDGLKPGDILVVNSHSQQIVDEWTERRNPNSKGDPISPQVVYTPHHEFIENYENQQGNIGGIVVDTAVELTRLPQETIGHIMVFQTHPRVSFAMITNASRNISSGYRVLSGR